MKTVLIERWLERSRDQESNIEFLKTCLSVSSGWKITSVDNKRFLKQGKFHFKIGMIFEKVKGDKSEEKVEKEWTRILTELDNLCHATRFQKVPFNIVEVDGQPYVRQEKPGGVQHALGDTDFLSLEEVKNNCYDSITQMLNNEDELMRVFDGIYDRNPQIRMVLSSLKTFFDTNGQVRNHTLLYGFPGCAKTEILKRIRLFLGNAAVVRLDATSTTSAGIYRLFFNEIQDVVPPIIMIEEIEKTDEAALRVWLGALDDRGELRKVTNNIQKVKEIEILCFATANDKILFDKLMGGSNNKPGALSSRFVNQIYCPRPDLNVLTKILTRHITQYGGKTEWIEPAIKLAGEFAEDDPRKVLSFLDGGDRLLDGSYQQDYREINSAVKLEAKSKYHILQQLLEKEFD